MARNQEKANVRRVSHALSPFFLARSSSSAFFFLRMIFRAMQRILCFTNWKRFVSFTCLFNRSMIEKRKNACVCVCEREQREQILLFSTTASDVYLSGSFLFSARVFEPRD
jgi:hypothetical protein